MRGFSYHLTPTAKPGIVKLRPTFSTYAKALIYGCAPTLTFIGVAWILDASQKRKNQKFENSPIEESLSDSE